MDEIPWPEFQMAARYQLRFCFEYGSGVCLWSGNETAIARFGYAVEPTVLPMPLELVVRMEELIAWYDRRLDWDNPPAIAADWDKAEEKRFQQAATHLLENVRSHLGRTYAIADERSKFD
ncbi:hypothetical protein ACQ4M4_06480 [Leptolyngbya sp. AN02str]|uniref:hypothetical protein n=1 Tax=Leptolyngbya sp. AN02str TaxID=3423363 RepID=UPI003D31B9D5